MERFYLDRSLNRQLKQISLLITSIGSTQTSHPSSMVSALTNYYEEISMGTHKALKLTAILLYSTVTIISRHTRLYQPTGTNSSY